MHTLLKKLNWKQQAPTVVLHADAAQLALLDIPAAHPCLLQMDALQPARFFIVFVATRQRLEQALSAILPQAEGDAILWMVYPKKSSALYAGELSRDHGWDSLRAAGWDTVRQVAFDEDWSALRFRRLGFIGQS
ncbi:hypothetical protein [Undibacterium rugosum]|uniref:DUF3052 family protein n=2 Tax=Undibacterium TaxID=401469 RepID=A0A923I702_9BURK|nr:hypothetical protein [Undibacterium rugosum]MBC3936776.1 hypothetical protein [Undibacterium rugosum]MBR7780204.1 hypothetical protein [Undibacterium rugosum]